ncbi:hypothetical protein A6A28_07460 [Streptomyces sp. CB03578]|nr:hypothetical protein A6A28_07460 [Streptomyces sp. CB03578]
MNTGERGPGDTKSEAGKRFIVLPEFMGGAPFRRTTFGRKWKKARKKVGLPEGFTLYDLRHTGHTLSTQSGATLKDTMVRAGQSSEKAAMICQHSNLERQREVAAGIDAWVQSLRATAAERASGTERSR